MDALCYAHGGMAQLLGIVAVRQHARQHTIPHNDDVPGGSPHSPCG